MDIVVVAKDYRFYYELRGSYVLTSPGGGASEMANNLAPSSEVTVFSIIPEALPQATSQPFPTQRDCVYV